MANLLNTIKTLLNEDHERPFSVYSSLKEQVLLNVPIAKPILIIVLSGNKQLGLGEELICPTGSFIFLSNSAAINMRNIPKDKEYFALLIEFEHADFDGLQINKAHKKDYVIGTTSADLEQCLQQFVALSSWAPKALWSLRKRELLSLLKHIGYAEVLSLLGEPQLKDRLHTLFIEQGFYALTTEHICQQLAMSASTLRRKLKSENTSVQEVKDQARSALALHLLQTSTMPIGLIAEQCGYQSQSRFTQRFKKRFGLTPSELRKTKMTD